MPEQTTTNCILSSIVTFLGGGLVGACLAHFFAKGREKNTRRIDFLEVVGEWRTKVKCPSAAKIAADFPQDVARFGGAYIALEPDLCRWKRSKFHALCDRIVAMTDNDVQKDKSKLLERIESIIALLT
jgi:hypothetical protein